jgi:hypothetical protein
MTTVNVGSILTVGNKAQWMDDSVSDTVTVTNVVATTVASYTYAWNVTISAPFPSNYRNGFVFFSIKSDDTRPGYGIVAVNANKTILTVVGDWKSNPAAAQDWWSYGTTIAPALGTGLVTTVNIIRRFQWYRDGIAIPDASASSYTAQNADIGKSISYKETGSYWDTPNLSANASSDSVSVAGTSLDTSLVYSENLVYRGSFGFQDTAAASPLYPSPVYNAKSLSINSVGGETTIYISMKDKVDQMWEYKVPQLVNMFDNPSYNSLNLATLARGMTGSREATEGKLYEYGVQGNEGRLQLFGSLPISNDQMLLSGVNFYTLARNTAFWVRPQNLTTTGSVSKPFFVMDTTPTAPQNPRWTSGYMCNIPSTTVNGKNYQTLLDADILSGAYTLSVTGGSQGPAAIAWKTTDISTTLTKAVTGNIVSVGTPGGGTANTLLGLGSAVTFDPTNDYLMITSGSGRLITVKITSWNAATKVATVKESSDNDVTPYGTTNITGVTRTNPVVISLQNVSVLYEGTHRDNGGIGITIKGVVGTTQLNGNSYYIKQAVAGNNTNWALYSDAALTIPVNGTAFGTYTTGGTADTIPTTASVYQIVPRVNGKQLLGHTQMMEPFYDYKISGVYSNVTGATGMVIPNGTRSLLYIGTSADGEYLYSAGNFNLSDKGTSGPIVYDTSGRYAGPHAWPLSVRVWAYDLDDLVEVKNGTGGKTWDGSYYEPATYTEGSTTPGTIKTNGTKPYAVMSLEIPNPPNATFMITSCAYDPSSRLIYMCAYGGGPFGRSVVHVYEITNAVIA